MGKQPLVKGFQILFTNNNHGAHIKISGQCPTLQETDQIVIVSIFLNIPILYEVNIDTLSLSQLTRSITQDQY